MSLVPRDRLAAACREADPETVADFVGALSAARGYEVERVGDRLLRLDPGGRTVAVSPADPTDLPSAADAVVAVDPGVRADSDTDVVDAADLHERLAYGVDRPVARDLLETHLGIDADADSAGDSPAGGVRDGWLPFARASLPWRGQRRALVLAAVAGVALLAALAAGGAAELTLDGHGSDGSPAASTLAPTPTPTGTPTGTPTSEASTPATPADTSAQIGDQHRVQRSLPPGIAPGGVESVDGLVAAHRIALSNTSFTLSVRYREFEGGRVTGVYAETIRVENGSRYRADVSTVGELRTTPRAVAGADLFVADGRRYVRESVAGSYFRSRASPSRFRRQVGQYLRWSLSAGESTLRDRRAAENRTVYRVTTDGDPYPGVENASGTAYVTGEGLVTYGRWTYTTPDAPDRRVEFVVRTTDVGTTTVGRPGWVDDGP